MSRALRARLAARRGELALELEFEVEDTLVIIGPNGAGKSTLLHALLGIVPATRGRIEVAGTLLFDGERGLSIPVEQRKLAYLPQDYGLFPHLTVAQNVAFALACANPRTSRKERARATSMAIERLDLGAQATRYPRTLSGGEKQRAALARTLCVAPKALLLDEPMAALDVHARRELVSALAGQLRELALPALVVTHDAYEAQLLGCRIAVLERGRFTQIGTWSDLVARPASNFVARFVASTGG
jgi:molybdate transport system ATP-binding protein